MQKIALQKLKICLVSISLGKGGAERSCSNLSFILSKLGYELTTVTLSNSIDYPYAGKLHNLGIEKLKKDTFSRRIKRFVKFKKYLNDQGFDFIIDHRPKNNILKEILYKQYIYKGHKTVYVYHTSKRENVVTKFPKLFTFFCGNNFSNVGVSEYITNSILAQYKLKNTATIYNAGFLNTDDLTIETLPQLKNKTYILSYGRIVDAIKDFSFLIDAFEASQLFLEKVYLVILGDGPDKDYLLKKASLSPAKDYILFLKFTEHPESIIKEAKVVTLTSRYEGFPMVLIESLSMGVPVIALDIISGPNEIIQHNYNGILVEKRKVNEFSEALKKMIFEEQFYKQCKKNAIPSVQQFSMEAISQQWHHILKL